MIKKLVLLTIILMAATSMVIVFQEILDSWQQGSLLGQLFLIEIAGFSILGFLGSLFLWKEARDD